MGKRMVILGAAESGVGAAVLAQKKGFDVFVSYMGYILRLYVDMLDRYGNCLEIGSHSVGLIVYDEVLIKSQGIAVYNPMVM